MHNLPVDVKSTLLGGAKILRQRGWCRFKMRELDGSVCARGAISLYLSRTNLTGVQQIELGEAAARAAGALLPKVPQSQSIYDPDIYRLVRWNDLHATSGEEVAQMLERAAGVLP